MRFQSTKIDGAYLIEPERIGDERGFFARTWCSREFAAEGLENRLVQCGIAYNERSGTLRGMHYQESPHTETKLVRCTQGAIFDAIVDLRPGSPTYLQWDAFELSATNRHMLYIPECVAHGYLTLTPGAEVVYQMSEFHHPECARGVRWDDPTFAIEWPAPVEVISERDARYADWPPAPGSGNWSASTCSA